MSDGALWLMAIAVAVSSISLLINAIASVGTLKVAKKLRDDLTPLIPEVERTLKSANEAIEKTAGEVHVAVEMAREVLTEIRDQVQHIDSARTEIAQQLRVHGQRLDLVAEDVLGRLQEVVGVFHGSVVRPVREVSGILAGVKTAVQTFMLGRKASVTRATQDEEMFI
jgi:methyl-accepting chemotaxis protein